MPQADMVWINAALLVSLLAVLYFFFLRPDRKTRQEKQRTQDGVKVGDQVSIRAGIHGTVTAVNGELLLIETGSARTELEVLRSAVLGTGGESGSRRIRNIPLNHGE